MTTEEKMNIHERRRCLRILKPRYQEASREERGRLLTAMEEATGLHRKSLIRLLHGDLERHPRQKQRQPTYGPEVTAVLQVIAESFDSICAERLTPNLVRMARGAPLGRPYAG